MANEEESDGETVYRSGVKGKGKARATTTGGGFPPASGAADGGGGAGPGWSGVPVGGGSGTGGGGGAGSGWSGVPVGGGSGTGIRGGAEGAGGEQAGPDDSDSSIDSDAGEKEPFS